MWRIVGADDLAGVYLESLSQLADVVDPRPARPGAALTNWYHGPRRSGLGLLISVGIQMGFK
jgi:hypothetical protein